MPRRAATSSSRPRGQIQSDGSSNTVTPVDTVSQYAVRGRNPPCEQFEDIQVNGETIRISKGGRRRYYHNLAIAFIKNCRHCFKMVCYCQHLLINKGFYMLDDEDNEEERLKSLHLYNDDEIIQKIVNDHHENVTRLQIEIIDDLIGSTSKKFECLHPDDV